MLDPGPMTLTVGIIVFIVFDTIIVLTIVFGVVRMTFQPLQQRYPACDPGPDAVTRTFQSFRFGVINMSWMVHVTVDENYLHLAPVDLMRRLGAQPSSIPWESVIIKKRSRSGKWIDATIDGRPLTGPAWCLELAEQ